MSVEELVDVPPVAELDAGSVAASKQRRRGPRRRAATWAVGLQGGEQSSGAGIVDMLRAEALEPTVVGLDHGERLPDPGSIDAAVIVGRRPGSRGPATAEAQADWLRAANRAGTPVLALGTAAQLLATALGGAVERTPTPRHGWVRVTTAIPQVIAPGPWLAWDDAIIRLPPGAALLASDRVGPQAFRVGGQLGVQFHPEATPQLVADWVNASEATLDYQGIMEATWRDARPASDVAHRLFASFIRNATRRRT